MMDLPFSIFPNVLDSINAGETAIVAEVGAGAVAAGVNKNVCSNSPFLTH
jgi:hypothetical protein